MAERGTLVADSNKKGEMAVIRETVLKLLRAGGGAFLSGEELSILVSQDWMNDCWDDVIANFEETHGF